MSLPRPVIPERVYMITRRCSERRFLLRPDVKTNNAFLYCLAVAAQKYDVKVIFTVAMSNHHHTGIVDSRGNLPDFLAHFHKLFAKHQNALRGRWEAFWASEQTSAVELAAGEDILEKMVYALGNPVKDHIVEKVSQWPGVNALAAIVDGTPMVATRPKTFFSPDGDMPASVELTFHVPESLKGICPSGLAAVLTERIADAEARAASERAESGGRIVGPDAVRTQHWNDSPESLEPRRKLGPRLACKNLWVRIEHLRRNKKWLSRYKVAREAFLGGTANVLFPFGTFWLRRFVGVQCEPDPFI